VIFFRKLKFENEIHPSNTTELGSDFAQIFFFWNLYSPSEINSKQYLKILSNLEKYEFSNIEISKSIDKGM